jgi:hypothetical protein
MASVVMKSVRSFRRWIRSGLAMHGVTLITAGTMTVRALLYVHQQLAIPETGAR